MIEKYVDHPDIEIFCTYDMIQVNQYDILKALTSCIMEKSLAEAVEGAIVLSIVSNEIFKKYQCHIHDCYEHPEYLNATLDDISRTMRHRISTNITNQLENFLMMRKYKNS